MSGHLAIEVPLFKDRPHGWIQWKGTDVCIDLHCSCGAHLHFDGDFLYHFICPHCDRMWEMGSHIPMYEVPAIRREFVIKERCVQTVDPDHDFAPTEETA